MSAEFAGQVIGCPTVLLGTFEGLGLLPLTPAVLPGAMREELGVLLERKETAVLRALQRHTTHTALHILILTPCITLHNTCIVTMH